MFYVISYDLFSPTSNRRKVEESIESLGKGGKFVSTTYIISTNISIDEVERRATEHLDSNDKMIICKVDGSIRGQLNLLERLELNEEI